MQPRFKLIKHPVIPSFHNTNDFIVATVHGTVDNLINLERCGSNPYYRDSYGWNAFLHAVNAGQVDKVRFLASRYGFDPNVRDRRGITALMIAAAKGDIVMMDTLVELGADMNVADSDGWRPIHYAVRHGEVSAAVRCIKRHGVDPNTPDLYGATAVMIAAENGDEIAVDKLVRRGARIDLTDHEGKGIMHYAGLNVQNYIDRKLIKFPNVLMGDPGSFVMRMPEGSDHQIDIDYDSRKFEFAKNIPSKYKIDINMKDNNGNTPIVYRLLNILDQYPLSMTMIYNYYGTDPFVQALIGSGADPWIKNNEGKNAFDIAREKGVVINWNGPKYTPQSPSL